MLRGRAVSLNPKPLNPNPIWGIGSLRQGLADLVIIIIMGIVVIIITIIVIIIVVTVVVVILVEMTITVIVVIIIERTCGKVTALPSGRPIEGALQAKRHQKVERI